MNALRILLLLCCVSPALQAGVAWREVLRQPEPWYGGDEAREIARSVLLYQTPEGGWPKNVDMTSPPSAEFSANKKFDHRAPTFDNGATTTQLVFLARVINAKGDVALRQSFLRGFDYVLGAQYANGGWPQYYPLIVGYYTHITYNDDAMINILSFLRDSAGGKAPYAFIDSDHRARAKQAVELGIGCILKTQVRQNGRLTVWCAQHDEVSFAPAAARNFEPVSLSGAESAGIVGFLMTVENPAPEIVSAIESAMAWFTEAEVKGIRIDNSVGSDGAKERRTVADPTASGLWARFYELGTNRPIFAGRDKVIHYDFNEIERERRTGYNYLGTWPAKLLARDFPQWKAAH